MLELIGRGGMGVVYKARQISLNRLVALKMVLAGDMAGPETLARFRAEARAAAQLQHPNLVQIFKVGEQEGRPFLSFEFIEGDGLDQRLRGILQLPKPSARLIKELAHAVPFAHSRSIVHRDLKPANMLLAQHERRAGDLDSTFTEEKRSSQRTDGKPPDSESQATTDRTSELLEAMEIPSPKPPNPSALNPGDPEGVSLRTGDAIHSADMNDALLAAQDVSSSSASFAPLRCKKELVAPQRSEECRGDMTCFAFLRLV